MKHILIIIGKLITYFIIAIVIYFIGFIIYSTLRDFSPTEKTVIWYVQNNYSDDIPDTLQSMIWNIGYAGLGEEMDFFYDGGKKVFSDYNTLQNNHKYIQSFIKANPKIDFWLFQ